ncbi:putative cysteine rich repeat domain protein [Methylococcus capsulatus str. Bath]|nr:putative cysteine rich repeat domain protein [Methylococcus capsulatus str. Bath]
MRDSSHHPINKEHLMYSARYLFAGLLLAAFMTQPACAAKKAETKASAPLEQAQVDDPVSTFKTGCKAELDKFCKDVMPGDGRQLACLYAYQDKLSTRCEYAIYDAAAQLQREVNALSYVAAECDDDLDKYCANVDPGEGRLLACLEKNEAKVSSRCEQAIQDTGLNKVK